MNHFECEFSSVKAVKLTCRKTLTILELLPWTGFCVTATYTYSALCYHAFKNVHLKLKSTNHGYLTNSVIIITLLTRHKTLKSSRMIAPST